MDSTPHILLFPFMSKGHTIPILHLARLLTHRNATVTVVTTPKNRSFISTSLSDTNVSVLELPFPDNIDGVPPGVESTDQLPEISLWLPLAVATKRMQPHFEAALKTLPPLSFMVTDGFLYWTFDSAAKFDVPRFVYYGMSCFASTVSALVSDAGLLREIESDDELISLPVFPRVKVTKNDFESVFTDSQPKGLHFEFVMNAVAATSKSRGVLVNSFYELESDFFEYWNSHFKPKAWSIGPLCLANPRSPGVRSGYWIQWLDDKLEQGKTVLYVAFGSQAEISEVQFREIKDGLEKSEVNFLWVVRKNESQTRDGFEERIEGRGIVVKEWVEQREILDHPCVQGFLSHCGWNSVIESICAKVPILAWPMMAEQPLNARMVADEIRIGIRVETGDDGSGRTRGFVKSENLEKSIKELMEGERGKEVRKNAKELGETAVKAVQEGGASWNTLNELLNEFHAKQM